MRMQSFLKNIDLDWDGAPVPAWDLRTDLARGEWEDGVNQTLRELRDVKPCATSRAVLDAIEAASRRVTVAPYLRHVWLADKGDANAEADAVDEAAATRSGGKSEHGVVGTGGGSDVLLIFTPQDWAPSTTTASLRARDETLFHELVHALRQMRGVEDSAALPAPLALLRKGDGPRSALGMGTVEKAGKYSQIYNDYEEFVPIVITNVYRSEKGRSGLRRDHLAEKGGDPELAFPLTNARVFYDIWKKPISKLCAEMPDVCDRIASVSCSFNPIFELYAAEDRFLPGTRVPAPR
jgi:hypothetical protein